MSFRACTRCICDTTAPEITFDAQGVCNFCTVWFEKEEERKREKMNLPWTYYKMRKAGLGKKYDVVLGVSGGVDSSACLHYLAQNGIRILAFHVENGYNKRKQADENILKMVEKLKIPLERVTLDLETFKEMQAYLFKSGVKNIESITDHCLRAVCYQKAVEHGVKYIVGGGNHVGEGIMPPSWGHPPEDLTFLRDIYKKYSGKDLTKLPTLSLWQYINCRFLRGIKVINLLDYYDFNREEMKKVLASEYDWTDHGGKHSDSYFTEWYQYYWLPTRYGIDKRKAWFSSLICAGQMTRRQAMQELLKLPEYSIFGIEDLVMKYPKSPNDYLDYKNEKRLRDILGKIYAYYCQSK